MVSGDCALCSVEVLKYVPNPSGWIGTYQIHHAEVRTNPVRTKSIRMPAAAQDDAPGRHDADGPSTARLEVQATELRRPWFVSREVICTRTVAA